jgi:hypothetical protein
MTMFPRYFLRRSEYAELWGISPTTLLRYEELGWVTPEYSDGGHRYYPAHIPPRRGMRQQPARAPLSRQAHPRWGEAPSSTAHTADYVRSDDPARRSLPNVQSPRVPSVAPQNPGRVRENAHREMVARLQALQASYRLVTLYRIDDVGEHVLTTVTGRLFSLAWVKRTFGGGHFRVDGVDFWVEGHPRV